MSDPRDALARLREGWARRLDARRAALRRIAAEPADKPGAFAWDGPAYGGRVGCRFRYAGPRDLTATLLAWHADHAAGDAPPVGYRELRDAAGDLWDAAAEAEALAAGS